MTPSYLVGILIKHQLGGVGGAELDQEPKIDKVYLFFFFPYNFKDDPWPDKVKVVMKREVNRSELIKKMKRKKLDLEALKRAFQEVDTNGNGLIDAYELRAALEKLGEQVYPEDVSQLMSLMDKDQSGDISWDEVSDPSIGDYTGDCVVYYREIVLEILSPYCSR
jgi:Ca2+-binding EF-hand superfamily protein